MWKWVTASWRVTTSRSWALLELDGSRIEKHASKIFLVGDCKDILMPRRG